MGHQGTDDREDSVHALILLLTNKNSIIILLRIEWIFTIRQDVVRKLNRKISSTDKCSMTFEK